MAGSEDYWKPPSPGQILGLWQWIHQELTDAEQASFLARPETLALAGMRRDVVEAAIRQTPLLKNILDEAVALEGRRSRIGREQATTRSVEPPPSPPRSSPKKPPSPQAAKAKKKSPTTRRKTAAGGNGPPPSNTFQHTSERYAGAMRHTPLESTPIERCEACGAAVAVGTAHDCW